MIICWWSETQLFILIFIIGMMDKVNCDTPNTSVNVLKCLKKSISSFKMSSSSACKHNSLYPSWFKTLSTSLSRLMMDSSINRVGFHRAEHEAFTASDLNWNAHLHHLWLKELCHHTGHSSSTGCWLAPTYLPSKKSISCH